MHRKISVDDPTGSVEFRLIRCLGMSCAMGGFHDMPSLALIVGPSRFPKQGSVKAMHIWPSHACRAAHTDLACP